jgi:hypothetical protein
MATKIKMVYAADSADVHITEHVIEVWTDGPHAAAGHVLDALLGSYNERKQVPMRMEIVPNAPDMPDVNLLIPETDQH